MIDEDTQTYYELLEVSETATTEEIKSAYRRVCHDYHPDKFGGQPAWVREEAAERFRQLKDAYDVLTDPARRATYDELRRSRFGTQQSSPPSSAPPPPPRSTPPPPRSTTPPSAPTPVPPPRKTWHTVVGWIAGYFILQTLGPITAAVLRPYNPNVGWEIGAPIIAALWIVAIGFGRAVTLWLRTDLPPQGPLMTGAVGMAVLVVLGIIAVATGPSRNTSSASAGQTETAPIAPAQIIPSASITSDRPLAEYKPDANTIALYHFNETSGDTILDFGPNHRNATATGTTIVTGRFGAARSLGNTFGATAHDFISLGNDGSFNPPRALTFEAWIKLQTQVPTEWTNGLPLFNRDDSWAGVQGYSFAIITPCNGVANALHFYDGDLSVCSATSIAINEWHHVAFTLEQEGGSKTAQIFLDGQLVGKQTVAGQVRTNAATTYIGRRWGSAGSFPYNSGFAGAIDEVRISDRVRSPKEFMTVAITLSESVGANRTRRIFSTAHSNVKDAWTAPGPFPDASVHFGNVLFPGPNIRWHGTVTTTDEKICLDVDNLTVPTNDGDPLRGDAYNDITVGYVIALDNAVFDDHTMTKTILIYQTRTGDRQPAHLEQCLPAHIINAPDTPPQIAGAWDGTFTDDNRTTRFTMQLAQERNRLTGSTTETDQNGYTTTATLEGFITNDNYVTLVKRFPDWLIGISYTARLNERGHVVGDWYSGLRTGRWNATNTALASPPSTLAEPTDSITPVKSERTERIAPISVEATARTDTIAPIITPSTAPIPRITEAPTGRTIASTRGSANVDWNRLGREYLLAGNTNDALHAWTTGRQLGRTIYLHVCRQRWVGNCEEGQLDVTSTVIIFWSRGKKLFTFPISETTITTDTATVDGIGSGERATLTHRDRHERLFYVPLHVNECTHSDYYLCTEQGVQIQRGANAFLASVINNTPVGRPN